MAKRKLREGTLDLRRNDLRILSGIVDLYTTRAFVQSKYIEQKMKNNNGWVTFFNRIKLAGNRYDGWYHACRTPLSLAQIGVVVFDIFKYCLVKAAVGKVLSLMQ